MTTSRSDGTDIFRKAVEAIEDALGRAMPAGVRGFADRLDTEMGKAAASGNPIGPVSVTRMRGLRRNDVAYLRIPLLDFGWVRLASSPVPAAGDPNRVTVTGTIQGDFEGAATRSWTEIGNSLVIIRPRP